MLSLVEVELWVLPIKTLSYYAELAQRQSTRLVSEWLWVRFPHSAPLLATHKKTCSDGHRIEWRNKKQPQYKPTEGRSEEGLAPMELKYKENWIDTALYPQEAVER